MKEKGFSLIELLIVVAILGITSAIAVPNLLKARQAAYEANAVQFLKSWLPGQEMYKKAHGFYAASDEELVTESFINKALNSDRNADDTGYLYSIDSSSTNPGGGPNTTAWFGRARRRNQAITRRSFYIDQTGVIRVRIGDTANVGDPPLN